MSSGRRLSLDFVIILRVPRNATSFVLSLRLYANIEREHGTSPDVWARPLHPEC